MKHSFVRSLFSASMLSVLFGIPASAQNLIVQTMYTADPAPMAYNNKVYLYTTNDEDNST